MAAAWFAPWGAKPPCCCDAKGVDPGEARLDDIERDAKEHLEIATLAERHAEQEPPGRFTTQTCEEPRGGFTEEGAAEEKRGEQPWGRFAENKAADEKAGAELQEVYLDDVERNAEEHLNHFTLAERDVERESSGSSAAETGEESHRSFPKDGATDEGVGSEYQGAHLDDVERHAKENLKNGILPDRHAAEEPSGGSTAQTREETLGGSAEEGAAEEQRSQEPRERERAGVELQEEHAGESTPTRCPNTEEKGADGQNREGNGADDRSLVVSTTGSAKLLAGCMNNAHVALWAFPCCGYRPPPSAPAPTTDAAASL